MSEKNPIDLRSTAALAATLTLAAGILAKSTGYSPAETAQASTPPVAHTSNGSKLQAAASEYEPRVKSSSIAPLNPEAATALGEGAWSYFADPRIVADTKGNVFTGWISKTGRVQATKYNPSTGQQETATIGDTGVDDHNNPVFHIRPDGRIMTFFSPHSGKHLPKKGKSEMYYRVTKRPGDIRSWLPTQRIPVNAPGELGYTYPNPVDLGGGSLFVAWRGGRWLPTYSIYKNKRWSPAKEIVSGEAGKRPYAKYAPGAPGSGVVHVAYTDAAAASSPTGIHYVQYRAGRGFFGAGGDRKGRVKDLPLPVTAGDTVHSYNEAEGSSWIMDVADDHAGNPVIVYTTGFSRPMQYFRYARWDGQRWQDHEITTTYDTERVNLAGGGHFQTGGIVLDHENPNRVYLSRIMNGRATVGTLSTPDGGTTWEQPQQLSPAGENCFRPAALRGGKLPVVAFLCGGLEHWTKYNTRAYIRQVDTGQPVSTPEYPLS